MIGYGVVVLAYELIKRGEPNRINGVFTFNPGG